jgi:hypothetical protein
MTQPLSFLRPGAWTEHAACRPADAERLDPILGGRPSPRELMIRTFAAQELCAHCPVRDTCGAVADRGTREYGPDQGVRGGSLRYEVSDPDHPLSGHFIAEALIPNAAESVHDHKAVAARLSAHQDGELDEQARESA